MNKLIKNSFKHKNSTVELSVSLPHTGIKQIDGVYSSAMYKGISAYCRKSAKKGMSGSVTAKCVIRESGAYMTVTTEINAFGREGRLCDVYCGGLPWKPSKKEKSAIKNAVYKSVDRKLRLGVKMYPSAPELSEKYFSLANVIPDENGFSVTYKKGLLADFETAIYIEKTNKLK